MGSHEIVGALAGGQQSGKSERADTRAGSQDQRSTGLLGFGGFTRSHAQEVMRNMTKLYLENEYHAPDGLTVDQRHDFDARMMAKAALYIDPTTWAGLYRDALGEVLGTGKGGKR